MPRFQNIAPSSHFEDRTGQSRFEGYLRQVLSPQSAEQQVSGGAPEGYKTWLLDRLQQLSPKEYAMMRKQGLQIEDIKDLQNKIKFLKSATPWDVDFRKLYNPDDLHSYPSDINDYPTLGQLLK